MNRKELRNLLKIKGVPEYYYNLDEVGETDQKVCLGIDNQGWIVYYSERGNKFDLLTFSTEDEACKDILKRLT
ncbi:hypothetical protein DEAC_c29050 [Desulfosporosinus acididurans]|uniref:Uncharacterized protein n=1 Tax=Desulfosporosinus acididurans TaxID=476652 RepID=A0A0J1FQU7_9FIRM|nr:hypothetical protein [Desulfosporosinus acididurans]KLU65353.1 hypothetical protein DEAC_c29050 [Desulfosporosinus acididurans]